jgi:hypothetical protein
MTTLDGMMTDDGTHDGDEIVGIVGMTAGMVIVP